MGGDLIDAAALRDGRKEVVVQAVRLIKDIVAVAKKN
jgi:hypothetical protein